MTVSLEDAASLAEIALAGCAMISWWQGGWGGGGGGGGDNTTGAMFA
jgi:hypothetical protein